MSIPIDDKYFKNRIEGICASYLLTLENMSYIAFKLNSYEFYEYATVVSTYHPSLMPGLPLTLIRRKSSPTPFPHKPNPLQDSPRHRVRCIPSTPPQLTTPSHMPSTNHPLELGNDD